MTEQVPGADGARTPNRPGDPEQIVDALEDRVLGHPVDQVREEDDDPGKAAFEQDLDTDDPDTGPGAEPAS